MANVSHGSRRKTRHKLRQDPGRTTTITEQLQEFDEGDHVTITINPSIHDGMPHPRFHGRTGVVTGIQGDAYIVSVETSRGEKQVITHPVHLSKSSTGDAQ